MSGSSYQTRSNTARPKCCLYVSTLFQPEVLLLGTQANTTEKHPTSLICNRTGLDSPCWVYLTGWSRLDWPNGNRQTVYHYKRKHRFQMRCLSNCVFPTCPSQQVSKVGFKYCRSQQATRQSRIADHSWPTGSKLGQDCERKHPQKSNFIDIFSLHIWVFSVLFGQLTGCSTSPLGNSSTKSFVVYSADSDHRATRGASKVKAIATRPKLPKSIISQDIQRGKHRNSSIPHKVRFQGHIRLSA